jgi:biopolymer transport protein ExbD
MRLHKTATIRGFIPTASMADIAFLLIIFFMLTTVFDIDRTEVYLPFSVKRDEIPRGAAMIVINKKNDRLHYRFSTGREMTTPFYSLQELYFNVSRITMVDETHPFVIKADADIRYRYIDEIIDTLRRAKAINIILLTRQKTIQ